MKGARKDLRACRASLGVILLIVGLWACATTVKPDLPRPVPGGVQFAVSLPEVTSVAVVGSFNGWAPSAHRMTRVTPKGLWSVVIPLAEGEHAFMYLVDGARWLVPPLAEDFVTDGFGQTNGLVVVR